MGMDHNIWGIFVGNLYRHVERALKILVVQAKTQKAALNLFGIQRLSLRNMGVQI